jgi:hypothetical protein
VKPGKKGDLAEGFRMDETPEDSPTLAEKMNSGMYLNPGFKQDKPTLVRALRDEIDDTAKRAQANVDQQRQNAADVDLIAKDLAREAHAKEVAAETPSSPDEA